MPWTVAVGFYKCLVDGFMGSQVLVSEPPVTSEVKSTALSKECVTLPSLLGLRNLSFSFHACI